MSDPYQAAVEEAAAILSIYRDTHGDFLFPTLKDRLLTIIEYRAAERGVDRIYVKRFKERMAPIVGQLRRIREANGSYLPDEENAVIYLCPSLDLDWQRFVTVKETGHLLLDKPGDYTTDFEQLDKILICFAQFDADQVTQQFLSEMRAIVFAQEVLFPIETRRKINDRYSAGNIAPADLAGHAWLPTAVIRRVMGAEYSAIVDRYYND